MLSVATPVDNIVQNTTTQSLQEQVSSKLLHLHNEQWSIKLPFRGICPVSAPDCIEHDDILAFCDKNHMLKVTGLVFRFSSELYPPTKEGLEQLTREIKLAAKLSGGVDLVSHGCTQANRTNFSNLTTKPQMCYRFVCSCGLIYQNESKKLDKENGVCTVNKSVQYRKSTLHNDRLNDRT